MDFKSDRMTPAFTLASQAFGIEKGTQVARFLVRLASNQSVQYDWLIGGDKDGTINLAEMVLDAVVELVILTDGSDDDPVDHLIEAWATVTSAYGRSRRRRQGEQTVRPGFWIALDEEVSDDSDAPVEPGWSLSWDGVPDRFREVIWGRLEGFTWAEVGAQAGYAVDERPHFSGCVSSMRAWSSGIGHLLDANPHLVERFGLVRCAESAHKHCRRCRGFRWVYENGDTL